MATELELALFSEELETVQRLAEATRWKLERDHSCPLGLFAEMHPRSAPTERYKARIRWNNYFEPFSLKFISLSNGSESDPTAWPRCFGFRPGSLDACIAWTSEGHAIHPDWKNSAMNRFPNVDAPMQFALLQIQSTLDNSYQGRGP